MGQYGTNYGSNYDTAPAGKYGVNYGANYDVAASPTITGGGSLFRPRYRLLYRHKGPALVQAIVLTRCGPAAKNSLVIKQAAKAGQRLVLAGIETFHQDVSTPEPRAPVANRRLAWVLRLLQMAAINELSA